MRKDVLQRSDVEGAQVPLHEKALLDQRPLCPHDVLHSRRSAQIVAVLELRLNQAVIGEQTSVSALNLAAAEIYAIAEKGGYKTGKLPDLK